jgi:hypothetical protein
VAGVFGGGGEEMKKRKKFFFENKNQKTFDSFGAYCGKDAPGSKSFLLLFFKKEVLPS